MLIVTGASGGLGLPLLEKLATVDRVVGTYNAHRPELPSGLPVQLYEVDVTDQESVRRFVEALAPITERITLVNLAGAISNRLAMDIDASEWDRVIAVNLKGSFLMSRALLRPMIRQRWGRIINVSSIAGREGIPGTAPYAAAKAGLHGLTRTLAKEYARYGILVNTLVLGYFAAGMTQALPDEQRNALLDRIPLRRLGDVAEIAEAITYLMRANYVTGTRLTIDGGLP